MELYNSKTKEYKVLKNGDPELENLKEKGYWNHKKGYFVGWTGSGWKEFQSEKEYHEWCSNK